MRVGCLLIAFCLPLWAQPPAVDLGEDGFVLIHTFTLTGGKICRKLDRILLPEGMPWHIRPEWHAIYLSPPAVAANLTPAGCQRGISQETLVGPLQKGKWQIFGVEEAVVGQRIAFTHREIIQKQGDAFEFATTMPAVLLAGAHENGNTTGACREFVPMRLEIEKTKTDTGRKMIRARLMPPPVPLESPRQVCRALPQTIAQEAIEIPPGKYRLTGTGLYRVEIYTQEVRPKSGKDSAKTGAQQTVK